MAIFSIFSRPADIAARAIVAGIVLACLVLMPPSARPALAQTRVTPNPGALTFTAAVDVPSVHVFRGFVREPDPGLTVQPMGGLALALASGDGPVKRVGVELGVWNSLQTGSAGSDGPAGRVHYREDFYSTLSLGFGGGLTFATTFTAYTSPNGMFRTVREASVKVSKAQRLDPYGLVAFELTDDGQADAGTRRGSYLELGVGPAFTLMADGPTLTIPVALGLSLKDYYERGSTDTRFGFLDIGARLTIPLKAVPGRFGSWNLHGGAHVFVLGDTTRQFNDDSAGKVVGLVGVGVTY